MAQWRHMRRVGEPNDARFLTFSCYRRLPLFADDQVKDAFAAHLDETCREKAVSLLAWVIMPEHVHLLIAQSENVSAFLMRLKRPFAQRAIARWRAIGAPILQNVTDARWGQRFWQQGGGYDRVMRSDEDTREKIQYIHSNPCRRGLVGQETEWAWSIARRVQAFDTPPARTKQSCVRS